MKTSYNISHCQLKIIWYYKEKQKDGRSFSLMKRAYLSVFTFIILFIGGCGLMGKKDISNMDPKDLPDVTAFQDDFTREFMTSTEDVEEGYYLFESKTGGYTMWYPEEATMDKHLYERKKKHFERLQFAEDNDTNST